MDLTSITDEYIFSAFKAVEDGRFRKESLADVIEKCLSENVSLDEAIRSLGLDMHIDLKDVQSVIIKILSERKDLYDLPKDLLKKRLMAIIMSEYKGKVDPKNVVALIDDVLRERKNG